MNEIKKIQNHTLKRFNNEIPELYSKYKNLNINYTEEIIVLKIKNIEIHLNHNYPFHPPAVFINRNPYINYLTVKSKFIAEILKKYVKTECLCCSTIICAANWTATHHIQKIMEEINYINETKRMVKYEIAVRLLYDKIKTPLPKDICDTILTYL
jgi:ubiquitin-protein ligase